MSTDADFGEQLETRTVAYLDRIDDCVALLPRALDEYASGGAYDETVDEIAAVESECDELVRGLTALITDAGPDDIGTSTSPRCSTSTTSSTWSRTTPSGSSRRWR